MKRLYWDEYTYPEIEELLKSEPVIILPIGSVEAHGYHLPLNTDMIQPLWLAEEIAKRMNAIILPPIHYGWTKGLSSFPGTISVGFETLKNLVLDILKEVVKHGGRKIIVLSGHASTNHMAALRLACEEMAGNGVKIMLLSDYYIAYQYRGKLVPEDDGHAGVLETSRVMAIRPELVKENYKFEKMPVGKYMVTPDYREFVPYATFSNPQGASKELGEKLNNIILEELLKIIKENFEV
ncbi:uncharacterized protein, putative amidase [Aciduliprofundum sp. MAR08-339]|uniref:creatininase family protein n=1 Tax=Aciduliprofundum sp. (strain MAR08-339) TaxID=673860 RepID=UPI0002A49667|nr:uncharacterized protein, putative amidase [Aciduliprofundum sp. MAR08-339]